MDFYFFSTIKFVHILSASVWFGASLLISMDIRQTLKTGVPHTKLLVSRVSSLEKIAIPSGLFTVISGIALIFVSGGFGSVSPRIHLSLVLSIILFLIGGFFASPEWRKISKIIESDGDLTLAFKHSKRFSMYLGIEHFLRFVILILMVYKF